MENTIPWILPSEVLQQYFRALADFSVRVKKYQHSGLHASARARPSPLPSLSFFAWSSSFELVKYRAWVLAQPKINKILLWLVKFINLKIPKIFFPSNKFMERWMTNVCGGVTPCVGAYQRYHLESSDDARRRQFWVAVLHEPRINPQAHRILL